MSKMDDLGTMMQDTLEEAVLNYKHDLRILPNVKVMKNM